jgi:hypothetical protein
MLLRRAAFFALRVGSGEKEEGEEEEVAEEEAMVRVASR